MVNRNSSGFAIWQDLSLSELYFFGNGYLFYRLFGC